VDDFSPISKQAMQMNEFSMPAWATRPSFGFISVQDDSGI